MVALEVKSQAHQNLQSVSGFAAHIPMTLHPVAVEIFRLKQGSKLTDIVILGTMTLLWLNNVKTA